MATQLADMTLVINNQVVAYEPNTLKFKEGQGEQKVRAAALGGNNVEQIYSHDVATNFGMVGFELPTTPENIELSRAWKANRNQNVVQLLGQTPEGSTTRTFQQAACLNDPEKAVGSETTIPIEFNTAPAV